MRAVGALSALMVLLASVLPGASPAYAHVSLVSSDPEQGATLQEAPAEVTLTFSGAINPELATVKVVQEDGTALHDGDTRVDGKQVTQSLLPGTGAATVTYKVVAVDGHSVQGVIQYTVAAESEAPTATAVADAPSPAPTKGRTVTRSWIWLVVGAGGLILIGALAYVLTVGRQRGSEGGPGDAGRTDDG